MSSTQDPVVGAAANPWPAVVLPSAESANDGAQSMNGAVTAIGRKAKRGLAWSFAGTALSKTLGLTQGIVLARVLTESDFGLFAVAFAATQLVMVIKDLGVIGATMQWRGRVEEMTPTATTIAFGFSTFLYVLVWFAAPSFASLAGNPDATAVVRLLTAVILVESVTAVRVGILMREFRQRRLVTANLCALLTNIVVSVGLAISGAGEMSLAAGQVAGAVVAGVIIMMSVRIPFRFGFNRRVARRLLHFGIPLTCAMAIESVLLNADFIIIGNQLDATQLGYYLLAFNISSWALTSIALSISYVSVASFARLSEMDSATFSSAAVRSMAMLYKVVVPIGALTAALAGPMVAALYGTNWLPAAEVLRVLAALTIVRVLVDFGHDIFVGAGKTRMTLWINIAWAAALIPALIIGVRADGIRGAGIAHAVVGLALVVPLTVIGLRRLHVHLGPVLPSLIWPTIAGAASAVVALATVRLVQAPTLIEVALAGLGGLGLYVVLVVPRDVARDWVWKVRRQLGRPAVAR